MQPSFCWQSESLLLSHHWVIPLFKEALQQRLISTHVWLGLAHALIKTVTQTSTQCRTEVQTEGVNKIVGGPCTD